MEININNNINKPNQNPSLKIIPELLNQRLSSRKHALLAWIISITINLLLIILSGFFYDAYNNTRKYIINGDDFWNIYKTRNLPPKAIPINSMLTAMILLLSFCFNIMNLTVILLYIAFGGVKDRLKFGNYVNLGMMFCLMVYSIIPIALYSNSLVLYILLVSLGVIKFMSSVCLFIFVRRIVKVEREKMLPWMVLRLHAKEYNEEYNSKVREIIGDQQFRPRVDNYNEEYNEENVGK